MNRILIYKKSLPHCCRRLLNNSVDLPGLEPRKPEPKTGVLPLHHRSIPKSDAKVRA